MTDETVKSANAPIDPVFYVNEASVDYLKRRIEADVKSTFFRWIGLPVGGAGVIAIVLTIFLWIPEKIETIIEKNPVIQKTLDESAIAYLNDPEKGQRHVGNQIKADIKRYFQDPEGGQKLVKEQIEKSASTQIENFTDSFFKSSGEPMIRRLSEAYLRSPEVRDLLYKSIENALKPKISALSDEIRKNTSKLVIETAMPSEEDTRKINKGTMDALFQFLDSQDAETVRIRKQPVALALTVRQGPRYGKYAVEEYINQLLDRFGAAFNSILVLDKDGTLIGRLDPGTVKVNLEPLMNLFNSGPQISLAEISKRLRLIGGGHCTSKITSDWTVMKALQSRIWSEPDRSDKKIPVTDAGGHFIGLTTRERLIRGILG